jgi:DNA-binding SARP family transcriptional activator
MTREALFAKAVAFNASRDAKHLIGLHHTHREAVLGMVSMLKDGYRQADIIATYRKPTTRTTSRGLSPMEADRVRRAFWADQHAKPRTLP